MCNGEMPTERVLAASLATSALVIGADGGGNILLAQDVIPDVVIGDLDSYTEVPDIPFEVILDPDQETNDLEKALKLALERGASEAVILGATGHRLDHTLKNLSVMLQFSEKFDEILLRDATCDIRILPRAFTMESRPGQIISLFPLSGRVSGVITGGLRYALKNESLENGIRDGSSNEATGHRISISHRSGDLLLIVPHHDGLYG
jgi:thiamine pyrophosphokinase